MSGPRAGFLSISTTPAAKHYRNFCQKRVVDMGISGGVVDMGIGGWGRDSVKKHWDSMGIPMCLPMGIHMGIPMVYLWLYPWVYPWV